ncbi:MAG: aconitate hydratase AcnA [Desulfobacterales bacterium]|nr:MAG: aconitate hydratase AcnA [Desulfobacterales bacterium]
MNSNDYIRRISAGSRDLAIYDIRKLEENGLADIERLPFSIRILVENLLRKMDGKIVTEADLLHIARWQKKYDAPVEIPHHPARVLMQDFTGVPAVVDLAAMRDAMAASGGDPASINPLIPVELVVDHSVQVDVFGTETALEQNVALEYERNAERYALLKWAQNSFDNFRVVPPNSGICHQVNLEYLSRLFITESEEDGALAWPDSLVGTDSHTTMINGLGIMGWGVGGIEAEAVMLGQPYFMSIPEVIGVRLTGALRPGVTATDLVLTITQRLREKGVVEKFVEFFGTGIADLTVADRATIANMSPEYGATMGFFPVDGRTIQFLVDTGRPDRAELAEACARASGLWYRPGDPEPDYTDILEIHMEDVASSLAGPARPQDRIILTEMARRFEDLRGCGHEEETESGQRIRFPGESGAGLRQYASCDPMGRRRCSLDINGRQVVIGDGSVVIAAITSCTNTSNPFVLMGAGLLARNAVRRGLSVPGHVKTSFAPGSRVVTRYMEDAGLMPWMDALGFHLTGYGCTTCIGNSGPLHPRIEYAIREYDLTVSAVLSGNRNFEARIHQRIKANYLASPMLVVAFALAGRMDINLLSHPLGLDPNGAPVYLEDIWPGTEEIRSLVSAHVKTEFFTEEYGRIFDGDRFWREMEAPGSAVFGWDDASTYIKSPPYFEGFSTNPQIPGDIENARALLLLGHSVTTDHISPAGAIPREYPAGKYLADHGVSVSDFNSYGSRRGNHEVMMRGTFGNIRIRNRLAGDREGSITRKFPENTEMSVFDAARAYAEDNTPLVVLGGKEYGTGSSRDWAAKGTNLLGVRAVIVESYERIHRSNLVGMGVLPLQFVDGQGIDSLKLTGEEEFSIAGIGDMRPRKRLNVIAKRPDGPPLEFPVEVRLNTDIEVAYFENGGILPYVLRKLMAG